MRIRKAKKEDLKEIYILVNKNIKYHKKFDKEKYGNLSKNNLKKYNENLKKSIKNKNSEILIAENNKKIIGYIYGIAEKETGAIADIFVTTTSRDKGIGKILIKRILAEFKKKKCKRAKVQAYYKNNIAIKTYESQKFKKKNLILERRI